VFRGLSDGRVVAYEAKTGKRLWVTTIADPTKGELVTAAPIAWKGLVYIGNAGSDNKGVKGHLFALDARDGRIVWEFFLVPRQPGDVVRGPLAPDPNTAAVNASWMNPPGFPITGGGTWSTVTIDSARGLLYIPGANPGADFQADERLGDN